MSSGPRDVTMFPSVTAGSSMKVAPAFSKSGRIANQPVTRLPRVKPASEMTHGPWQGRTYGGSSFVADAAGKILLTLRDRDSDLQVIAVPVGSQAK